MPSVSNSKTSVTHPQTGTKMNIDSTVYKVFSSAILSVLKGNKGKTFTILAEDVARVVRRKMPGFTGSANWYTITIRLDMEARGLLETFIEKGKKFTRLKK